MRRASLTPTAPLTSTALRRTNSENPDDEYDYKDTGPSTSLTNPKQRPDDLSSVLTGAVSDDPDGFVGVDEGRPIIYEKETNGNRAKLPDDFNRSNAAVAANGPSIAPATATTPHKGRRRKFFNVCVYGQEPRSAEQTSLRRIDLNWSPERVGDTNKIVVNTCVVNEASSRQITSVFWQHSNYENAKLEELEKLLPHLRSHGLQESEIGLSRRLINRVGLMAEHHFVNGRFLSPVAIRYDMLDDSRYNKDKCSMFLSFPYFTIRKPEDPPPSFRNGAPEHPMRTLLQSRYRLNETTKRDESQCISELVGDKLKHGIKAPESETAHLNGKKVEELIYVPQMWALIVGLDRIITVSPITDEALYKPVLSIRDTSGTAEHKKCAFVQISFLNHGISESHIYPIDQCRSWFGLLNIHQQLRSVLVQGKEKNVAKDFRLRSGFHTLSGNTWASVQRATKTEILNIWMVTPQVPAVSVQNSEGKPISEHQGGQEPSEESMQEEPPVGTAANPAYTELGSNLGTKPFLEWQVLDDFGIKDDSSNQVKTERFLLVIYHSLSAFCEMQDDVEATQTAQTTTHSASSPLSDQQQHDEASHSGQTFINRVSGNGKPSISVAGKSAKDVDDLTYELQKAAPSTDEVVEQRLRKTSVELFNFYMPQDHEPNLPAIQLFWGLLYEVIKTHQQIPILFQKVQAITKWARRLHVGVRYEQFTLLEDGMETWPSETSDHAILQATMVDALGAIYNMFEFSVRASRSSHAADSNSKLWSKALQFGDEACLLLEKARDGLIAEATGSAPGEGLGPVLTSEAIMIKVLERLSLGVYGSGNVNVIHILEACLEQLALDVENKPSRRLLKRINAFLEEVDIIKGVLLQQLKVLFEFQACLDPKEFKRPTTARKMRFKFEKPGIETMITHIDEQRRNCKELCTRAKVLEDQNMRLVETLADDQGRAIFIFTFITILFLPLSFVATFFGMNVEGINPTSSTTSHFWAISAPLTGGIFFLCLIFVFKGEQVLFSVQSLPIYCLEMMRLDGKEKFIS